MSVHNFSTNKVITSLDIRKMKGTKKIAMITAYDYSMARIAEAGGVDSVLVGDSLGMVMLGREDTVSVTLDEMIHHASTVVKGIEKALVIVDMPFMTYESGVESALRNATKLVQSSGARAVKLEGGKNIAAQVKAIVDVGIPVCGHIGLTPQRASILGGFKVQGKTAEAARLLLEDAQALEASGCFCLVLEAIPAPVAKIITDKINIPTVGIGAGADCDGQVLVIHDMLGLNTGHVPRFVKKYASLAEEGIKGIHQYVEDVQTGVFPTEEQSFTMTDQEKNKLKI